MGGRGPRLGRRTPLLGSTCSSPRPLLAGGRTAKEEGEGSPGLAGELRSRGELCSHFRPSLDKSVPDGSQKQKKRRTCRPGGVEAGSGASLVLRSAARFGAGAGELRPAGRMGVGWAGTLPGPCRTLLQIGELRPRARPRESMRMAELHLCRPQGERPGSSWRHLALRSGRLFAHH